MLVEPGGPSGPEEEERRISSWRIIVSAWAIVLVFAVLFALLYALSPRTSPPAGKLQPPLVIPKHEPGCGSATNPNACPQPGPIVFPGPTMGYID